MKLRRHTTRKSAQNKILLARNTAGAILWQVFGQQIWRNTLGKACWHVELVAQPSCVESGGIGIQFASFALYNSLRQPTSWRKYEFTNSELCRRRFLILTALNFGLKKRRIVYANVRLACSVSAPLWNTWDSVWST